MVYRTSFRIVVLFIIALSRLRFPRDESLVTTIRRRYSDNVAKLIRKFEKTDKKLRKAELDLDFLKKCDELLVFPNFLNFKVTNEQLKNSPAYDSCRKILLDEEINIKDGAISDLKIQLVNIKDNLKAKLNIIDYTRIVSCFSQSNDKYIDLHQTIQDKKLCKLVKKFGSIQNDPRKVIHNFSNYELSSTEKVVLIKGLKFSINPGLLNYGDYCASFELLFRDIKKNANLSLHNLDVVKTKLKDVALSSFEDHNKLPNRYSNLSKKEFEVLKNLSKNANLVIQKSDKGNAVVILNREDYIERINELLSDTSKFNVANLNDQNVMRYLTNIRKSFKTVLDDLLTKKKISQQTFFKLDPVGCRPGILYGLSKVHKALVRGIPKMRPILSAIGTASYNLSKFLVPLMETIAVGPYTISNSFSFNKEILKQDSSLFMGSLDVDALFTSIPLDETIKISVDSLFNDKNLVEGLTKSEFRKLLSLASKNSLFLFDGIYYFQTDGVAMGSPLGPRLADVFMNYYEQIWLNECPIEFKPKFYRRYVDDIFVLVESQEHLEKFKEYLNSKHQNIKFTSEFEVDGKLPFLDMLIDRSSGIIKTSVYRKPTFTGVYTHYHSFLPSVYKFGLLSTILFRYFAICSNFHLFHIEVQKFKETFLRNGYPIELVNKCVKTFLDKVFITKPIIHTVSKKEYTITLPYLEPLSNKVHRRIKTLFQKVIPAGKLNIIFKTKRRLAHFLKFKDVIPYNLNSHIIYHFTCPSCKAGYIGETRVYFKVRGCQHLGISEWSGRSLKGSNPTAITKHIKSKNCICSLDDFTIIGREEDFHLRLLKESLFIKLKNYELNKQQSSSELFLF